MSFAAFVIRQNWVDGHVILARRFEHPRFRRIETFSPRNHLHACRFTELDEVDDDVAAWFVEAYRVGGKHVARRHKIVADEPCELLGADSGPNPQELLMAAFNACITVGYVAGASVRGIRLDSLEIKTRGELDLRGFLGLDDQVPPGYESIDCEVLIKGDGTPEQFEEIHQAVVRTSPNYFNISRPVKVNATLRVG